MIGTSKIHFWKFQNPYFFHMLSMFSIKNMMTVFFLRFWDAFWHPFWVILGAFGPTNREKCVNKSLKSNIHREQMRQQ